MIHDQKVPVGDEGAVYSGPEYTYLPKALTSFKAVSA
jgi:hypothetical protein